MMHLSSRVSLLSVGISKCRLIVYPCKCPLIAERAFLPLPSMVYPQELTPCGAEPQSGQTATLHYAGPAPALAFIYPRSSPHGRRAGYLLDGAPFDSSYERRRPFSFRVGGGDVIRGWDEAVRSMRVGGRRVIIIPPALGYGAGGAGGGRIPGGATLVFFLELLSIAT